MQNKLSNINIRATSLEMFWGVRYPHYAYLSYGALNKRSLSDINEADASVLPDPFAGEVEFRAAYTYCKSFYEKILPVLAAQINKINQQNFSVSFYRTSLGYWLYRHISVVYDKYKILSSIDIDQTDIRLLDKSSFFVPFNHFDYFYCFTSDFGVMQLVSLYYTLFSKNKFESVKYAFVSEIENKEFGNFVQACFSSKKDKAKKFIRSITQGNQKINTTVDLLEVYFTHEIKSELALKSNGRIADMHLPKPDLLKKPIDKQKRSQLTAITCDNDFEFFFAQSLFYSVPKLFIEYMNEYICAFQTELISKKCRYVVSEGWISHIPSSLYIGLFRESGGKFICYEHAANTVLYDCNLLWHEEASSDIFLTVGWKDPNTNSTAGGFCIRDKVPYQHSVAKNKILFVDFIRPVYPIEFSANNFANSRYLKQIRLVSKFLGCIPDHLKEDLFYRPRIAKGFLNTEIILRINEMNIKVDHGDFAVSLQNARLVIINHMSSGLAEIVLNDIPFILLLDYDLELFNPDYLDLIMEFKEANILHFSVETALKHISLDKESFFLWWQSAVVQKALDKYRTKILGNPQLVISKLVSLSKHEANKQGSINCI